MALNDRHDLIQSSSQNPRNFVPRRTRSLSAEREPKPSKKGPPVQGSIPKGGDAPRPPSPGGNPSPVSDSQVPKPPIQQHPQFVPPAYAQGPPPVGGIPLPPLMGGVPNQVPGQPPQVPPPFQNGGGWQASAPWGGQWGGNFQGHQWQPNPGKGKGKGNQWFPSNQKGGKGKGDGKGQAKGTGRGKGGK